jgi:hypothetical protein
MAAIPITKTTAKDFMPGTLNDIAMTTLASLPKIY